ncbi:hypothetical protein GCM10010191_46760 [Actinomadura vinacea]|uniref:Uncharacterized protein n=1 Tax=Actinomadura vinacea TaxID=115336 RepID=A0ABN3JGP0_9ACTN
MGMGDLAGDRQAEAGSPAVELVARRKPGVPFEDLFPFGLGDSRTIVGDDHFGAVPVLADLDLNAPRGVPLSVVQQVGEQPAELDTARVDDHSGLQPELVAHPVAASQDLCVDQLRQVQILPGPVAIA